MVIQNLPMKSFLLVCIFLLPIVFILKNLFLFFFHIIEGKLIYKTLTEFLKKKFIEYFYSKNIIFI